jgi:hypothetical protein
VKRLPTDRSGIREELERIKKERLARKEAEKDQ